MRGVKYIKADFVFQCAEPRSKVSPGALRRVLDSEARTWNLLRRPLCSAVASIETQWSTLKWVTCVRMGLRTQHGSAF